MVSGVEQRLVTVSSPSLEAAGQGDGGQGYGRQNAVFSHEAVMKCISSLYPLHGGEGGKWGNDEEGTLPYAAAGGKQGQVVLMPFFLIPFLLAACLTWRRQGTWMAG